MNKKATAVGLFIGLVIGGIVALLTTPQKGKDTRAAIAKKFTEVKDTVGKLSVLS